MYSDTLLAWALRKEVTLNQVEKSAGLMTLACASTEFGNVQLNSAAKPVANWWKDCGISVNSVLSKYLTTTKIRGIGSWFVLKFRVAGRVDVGYRAMISLSCRERKGPSL